MAARVIVLAGPSGTGKTRLAARVGLPVLRLDDFYLDASSPSLPVTRTGANAGLVDWDHPDSWSRREAVEGIARLCRDGRAEVPVYDLARDGRCGARTLDLAGSSLFLAEGIFAQEVVPECAARGLLAAAYCLRQHPVVTFWRRLTRDLRERRKPPLVLVRRGLALTRAQGRVVRHAGELGCRPMTPEQALRAIRRLAGSADRSAPASAVAAALPGSAPTLSALALGLPQPDRRSCGAAVLVLARMLRDAEYARLVAGPVTASARGGTPASANPLGAVRERFAAETLSVHRRVTRLVGPHERRQPPWPRALGTPPWAVARELGDAGRPGAGARRYAVRPVPPWARGDIFDRVGRAVAEGSPVPIYVGNRVTPRHVVLALAVEPAPDLAVDRAPDCAVEQAFDGVRVYDPARGGLRSVSRADFVAGRLHLGRWNLPWFAVLPSR